MRKFLLIFIFFLPWQLNFAQCYTDVTAYGAKEKLVYSISYNWGFIWLNAGEVYFKTDSLVSNNRTVYFFDSYGATFPDYDWIFKVRDRYQSYVDKETFKPLKFERVVYEGGTKIYNKYLYDSKNKKIYTVFENNTTPRYNDTLNYPDCSFDVLTLLYYCRNIDFSKFTYDSKIPLTLIIDNEIHNVYLRYLGKEQIKSRDGQHYNCIKFRPKLVDGTIFKGGEDMTVWVTDDNNKIPIYVEAKIMIGSIKVYLTEAKGLIHPLTSKKS